MIRGILKISLILNIVISLLIILFTRQVIYVLVYLVGGLTSYLCLYINSKLITFKSSRLAFIRNMSSFSLRMSIYVGELFLVIKYFGIRELLFCFLGIVSLRYAIFIQAAMQKGGNDENY